MERPLSPFMFPTWYRFQITSALSILHRLMGIALAVGSILLVWWLIAVAAGGELFTATHRTVEAVIKLRSRVVDDRHRRTEKMIRLNDGPVRQD